jgi:hypothetical protein
MIGELKWVRKIENELRQLFSAVRRSCWKSLLVQNARTIPFGSNDALRR